MFLPAQRASRSRRRWRERSSHAARLWDARNRLHSFVDTQSNFHDQRGIGKPIPRLFLSMRYQFLIDTYETEILKVLSVWSSFQDDDLSSRPHPTDKRGR